VIEQDKKASKKAAAAAAGADGEGEGDGDGDSKGEDTAMAAAKAGSRAACFVHPCKPVECQCQQTRRKTKEKNKKYLKHTSVHSFLHRGWLTLATEIRKSTEC
jgi:hypothetical protein